MLLRDRKKLVSHRPPLNNAFFLAFTEDPFSAVGAKGLVAELRVPFFQ